MVNTLTGKTARRTMLICLVLAIVVFWIAASQITKQGMAGWERAAFDLFYNLPLSLKPYALAITQAGSALMIAGVCAALFLTRHRMYAIRVFVLSVITYGLAWGAKHFFERPRPNVLLTYVSQRGPLESGFGFPSAHSAIAMTLGVVLLPLLPRKYWWVVFTVVLLVGSSRLYLGVHSPLDVIGGFALGAITSLSYLLFMGSRQNKRLKAAEGVSKTTPKS